MKVPFHPETGEMMTYVRAVVVDGHMRQPVWRENFEFLAKLRFETFDRRGRSAVHAIMVDDETGMRYVMFLKDLKEMILAGLGPNPCRTARWTFVKRGTNYGVTVA